MALSTYTNENPLHLHAPIPFPPPLLLEPHGEEAVGPCYLAWYGLRQGFPKSLMDLAVRSLPTSAPIQMQLVCVFGV